jgi:hypothetical protein
MATKSLITGFKRMKGEVEGFKYDYVKVFGIAKLKPDDDQRGAAGVEMKALPDVFDKLKKINFSTFVMCEIDTETYAKGKGASEEYIVDIKPVDPKAYLDQKAAA